MVAKEHHKPLECVVEDGHAGTTGEGGEVHAAGLGIELAHGTMTVTRVENGQCKCNGVQVGMTIVGVNGSPLIQILYDSGDPVEFGEFVNAAKKPLIINFNAMQGASHHATEEVYRHNELVMQDRTLIDHQLILSANDNQTDPQASNGSKIAQPAQPHNFVVRSLDNSLTLEFRELMIRGIVVQKQHAKGFVLNTESRRVLFMDTNFQTLICGKSKGARTNKVFSVHDIRSVNAVENEPCQLRISTKSGAMLQLRVSNTQFRDSLAEQMYALCMSEQAKFHTSTTESCGVQGGSSAT